MYVATDGRHKWIGEYEINTGFGKVTPGNPGKLKVFKAFFVDELEKIKRGPQIMHKKDVGLIIAHTGIGSGSKVAEGGAGNGFLTAYLARIVYPEKLYSYEIRRDFYELAKRNLEKLGIKNVVLKNKSIFELEEKELDVVIFDLPNPWEGVEKAYEALKEGGFLVCYLPTVQQVLELLRALNGKFFEVKVFQNQLIEWKPSLRALRPVSTQVVHTAFLIFARKF